MTDTKKTQLTSDGAVELEEAALDKASGGLGPPDTRPGDSVGIIAVNKIAPGAIKGIIIR